MFAQADIPSTILWFVILFIFIALYPRLMLSQMIWKLEQSAQKLENMTERAVRLSSKKTGRPTKEINDKIMNFTDFFAIDPSSLDPYGIVRKIDQIVRQTENRFQEFVLEIAPQKSAKEQQELNYALRATISLRMISKIVRHNVELAKRFKNLQIAMILQMQMPIIEKLAESEFHGAEAFINGWPIGDGIGPLVAANLINTAKPVAEGIVLGKTKIDDRNVIVLKPHGPEPHLGRIDEAITAVLKRHKIARVVTIDAMQKFEGEKSGSVAEGVGFAMGGVAQREIIENILLPSRKPIDSVTIKVGIFEAIQPMRPSIHNATTRALEAVRTAIRRAPRGSTVLVIGVGNSCGIPDTKSELGKVKEIVEKLEKERKAEQKKKKQKDEWE